ncbi:MAG: hypothetical protein P8Y73_10800, partial [Desulfuromonadales bacterium]
PLTATCVYGAGQNSADALDIRPRLSGGLFLRSARLNRMEKSRKALKFFVVYAGNQGIATAKHLASCQQNTKSLPPPPLCIFVPYMLMFVIHYNNHQ